MPTFLEDIFMHAEPLHLGYILKYCCMEFNVV